MSAHPVEVRPVRRARASRGSVVLAPALLVSLLARGLDSPASADGARAASSSLQRASSHPMRYHLVLPAGWEAGRSWPVLVVIPDAARDFQANLMKFAAVRGERPYILVAPEVLSCGGARSRTPDRYSYTRAEWDSLQRGNDFAFEDAGLGAVLADVQRQWNGEPKAFLTGWEAGGHTVWAQAFRHPERWRGVAPVTTNYQRRGLDPTEFSSAPERTSLPIQPFRCGAPTGDMAKFASTLDAQVDRALQDGRAHGFHPRPVRLVPGADHGPLPEAVLAWCDSLRGRPPK
jgi:dienelactone hydrolase